MPKPFLSLLLCCSLLPVLLAGCGGRKEYPRGWKTEDVDYAQFLPPIAREQKEFVLKVERLLKAGDYAAIEEQAAQCRRSNEEFLNGISKLSELYYGLAVGSEVETDADWRERNRLLLEWRKKQPRSITAQVALANNYFWGGKIAATAGSDRTKQDKLAEQRHGLADKVLHEPNPSVRNCAGWYLVKQSVLMAVPPPQPLFARLTDEAVARYPNVKELYMNRISYLAGPKHDAPGQWQAYAARITDQMKDRAGDRFYAQVVWYYLRLRKESLYPQFKLFDWPRAKHGFELLMNDDPQNPASVAGPYAVAAWLARDRATLKLLFENHIDKRIDATVWSKVAQFTAARRWAVNNERGMMNAEYRQPG